MTSETQPQQEAFTAREVAKMFAVSVPTVYRDAQDGGPLGGFRVRRSWRFPRSRVMKLLQVFEESQAEPVPAQGGQRHVAA